MGCPAYSNESMHLSSLRSFRSVSEAEQAARAYNMGCRTVAYSQCQSSCDVSLSALSATLLLQNALVTLPHSSRAQPELRDDSRRCNRISERGETVQDYVCGDTEQIAALRVGGSAKHSEAARCTWVDAGCSAMNSFANRKTMKRLIYNLSDAAGRMHDWVPFVSTRVWTIAAGVASFTIRNLHDQAGGIWRRSFRIESLRVCCRTAVCAALCDAHSAML